MDDDKEFYEDGASLAERFERIAGSGDHSAYFDSEELELLIDYYIATDKLDMAEKAQRFGSAMYPQDSEIHIRLAKIYLLQEKYTEAEAILREMDSLEDDYIGVLAECIARNGDIPHSISMFRKYLQDCLADEINIVYLDIAALYNSIGQHAVAAGFLEEAGILYPEDIDICNELGYTYQLEDNYEKAVECHNRAIDLAPYNSESWCCLGSAYSKTDMNKAADAYSMALAIDPDNMQAVQQKAYCLYCLSRYEEAIGAYRQCLDADSNNTDILISCARCYEAAGDYDTALDIYKKIIEIDPASCNDGLIKWAMGETDKSIQCAILAFRHDPLDVNVSYRLAKKHEDRALLSNSEIDYENALDLYRHCTELDPDNGHYWIQAANIYLNRSEYDKARQYYETAYALDPLSEKLTIMLAITCYCQKDREAFFRYYNEAAASYPDACDIITDFFPDAAQWIDLADKHARHIN